MARIIVAAVFVSFIVLNFLQERGFKKRGLETVGRKPVDGRLFAAGKISTLLTWLAAFLQACGVNMRIIAVPRQLEYLAAALFLAGFAGLWAAYRDLGDANAAGLPEKTTELKTGGLYASSRNPLYLGLYAMTAGAVLYSGCAVVLLLGIVSVAVHHRTVLAEEKFLEERFGRAYLDYRARVPRYL